MEDPLDIKNDIQHVEASTAAPKSKDDAGNNDFIANYIGLASNDARDINDDEKIMSLSTGLKLYPKAIMWSVIVSSSLIMEGYDLALLSNFYALPAFKDKFGVLGSDGTREVPSKWQTGLTMCVNCGEIIGLQFAGWFADNLGYKKTMGTFLVFVTGFLFILFFAPTLAVLAVGEILIGICFGCFQTMAVNYASDVCPLALRYYLTTYINICWVFGQLVASGVLRAKANDSTDWAYKVPYAIQWIWPVPIFIGILFAPESPWWLVKKGKYAQAKNSIKRLLTQHEDQPDINITSENMIKFMKLTNDLEKEKNEGTSYLDCFKGVDLRRTEITVVAWLFQNECGNALMVYSTYFFQQAGLSTDYSFDFTIIMYALGIAGCLCSWFLSKFTGRFEIYFGGLATMFILMFVTGCLGLAPKHLDGPKWAVGSLLIIACFVYDMTLGPVCYAIVSEMASTRLRIKTVIISRNIYNIGGIFNAIVTPYMLNPQSWDWSSKTGFFWAGSCFLGMIWAWFRLPETKGRTFVELDMLFEHKVPARKFKSTEVDPFSEEHLTKLKNEEDYNLVKKEIEDFS
ncbi:alpha-glucoside permease [Saccharomycopsis crataegensis]|uniref:Alpha-glucoside permease n=1 Tax=Saccharomycopsis crataegensis TaxID=43959 RepID=A0AAV5QKP3_9ASCO|nr:alpha-glucoside permease [Saccharomycopsis crataegensis]